MKGSEWANLPHITFCRFPFKLCSKLSLAVCRRIYISAKIQTRPWQHTCLKICCTIVVFLCWAQNMVRRLRLRRIPTSASAAATISSGSSEEDERSDRNSESEASESDEADAPPAVSTTPASTSRPRKRMRRSINWKKNVRKRRRNAGLRYTSDTTNRVVRYMVHVYAPIDIRTFNHYFCPIGNSKASIKDILWSFKAMFLNNAVKDC
jgi:hypothetical protein